MKLRVLLRLLEIQRVLLRHGLDDFVRATHLYRPLRFLFYLSPVDLVRAPPRRAARGERLRLALEELGPIFVKFGQALSTRRDLLPPDIADELAKLQDRVPPFPGERGARQRSSAPTAGRVDELFAQFDETPLAAASIAQVHAARLPDGARSRRQGAAPRHARGRSSATSRCCTRSRDLAQRYWPEARRLRPLEVVREYEKTILDELDLMREAANASQLKRNFAGSTLLYVPEVLLGLLPHRRHGHGAHPRRADQRHGAPARRAAPTSRSWPRTACEIFFTQVFRHNFFHADMHPGNIFVLIDDPAQPRYAAVDFGIVGTLDPRDQHYLAENFLAVFDRDYRRVAQLHVESGWVPRGHARRRDGIRGAHGLRADLRPAAEGHLLRHACCCACSRSRGASTCRSSRS